jgi:adenine phosphoribosyltransferase
MKISPQNIIVGSNSPIKVRTVQRLFPDSVVVGTPTESGIPEQPVSEAQTIRGAIKRCNTNAIRWNIGSRPDLFVGIENGIVQDGHNWEDKCMVYIEYNGMYGFGMSRGMKIPHVFDATDQSTTWASKLHSVGLVTDTDNPHKDFGYDREEQITEAIMFAVSDIEIQMKTIRDTMELVSFKGIDTFCDIGGLLMDYKAFGCAIDIMANQVTKLHVPNKCIGMIDARGFVIGTALARKMRLPCFMVRKSGKMPNVVTSKTYSKEYEEDDALCVSKNITGRNVILVDDILATGGTFRAAKELLESNHNKVIAGLFLVAYPAFDVQENIPMFRILEL